MAENTKPTSKKAETGEVMKSRTSDSLDVLVGQLESNVPQQFSDKHIDRYFDGKEKLYKLIREDHKDEKSLIEHGRKYTLFYMLAVGGVVIVFVGIIAYANKDSLDKFIELLFAFLGGTGVGTVGTNLINKKTNE